MDLVTRIDFRVEFGMVEDLFAVDNLDLTILPIKPDLPLIGKVCETAGGGNSLRDRHRTGVLLLRWISHFPFHVVDTEHICKDGGGQLLEVVGYIAFTNLLLQLTRCFVCSMKA